MSQLRSTITYYYSEHVLLLGRVPAASINASCDGRSGTLERVSAVGPDVLGLLLRRERGRLLFHHYPVHDGVTADGYEHVYSHGHHAHLLDTTRLWTVRSIRVSSTISRLHFDSSTDHFYDIPVFEPDADETYAADIVSRTA